VEIISRDRASRYAQAATAGAPAATQIADRYHLLANLGDALQRLLDRHSGAMKAVTELLAQLAAVVLAPPAIVTLSAGCAAGHGDLLKHRPEDLAQSSSEQLQLLPEQLPHAEPMHTTTSSAAPATATPTPAVARRFAAIKELQAQGCGQREIAKRLQLHRRT